MFDFDFGFNPFPGMNPHVESVVNWSDFHSTFIGALREAINQQLPGSYYAKITELMMMVEPVTDDRQRREPDVLIGRGGSRRPAATSGASATALLEPDVMENVTAWDPYTEVQIEILRMPQMELVTIIELLSPTNKQGEGRGIYLQKRDELLRTKANIVEIDLIRRGPRLRLNKPLQPDDYYAFISRGDRRPSCDVYHWSMRDPLPVIPIPLRTPDADLLIGLREPFRVAFERGQYGRFIDYTNPPPPPELSAEDSDWMAAVLKSGADAKKN